MPTQKLIVFDMDGVIMDVSGSYRDTVRQTATLFFKEAKDAAQLPVPLFQLSDLAGVKQSGGLNNDWDLTFLIIDLLFTLVPKPPVAESEDPWARYRETIRRCDVSALAGYLKRTPRPLESLYKQRGKPADPFIAGLYDADVGNGNIIKQIFQEIYLGQTLFESTYYRPTVMYHDAGYIQREKILINPAVLEALAQEHILAIATGRPKAEADYPLRNHDIRKFFRVVYTLDDCISEEKRIFEQEGQRVSLSKPHPFMLDAIVKTLKEQISECYYVGDMPDDMQAAAHSRAAFVSIGLVLAAPDKVRLRKELSRAGADYIAEDFEALKAFLNAHR
ncbi:MAG: HAD family hydrolase [Desulfobacterales bacterium]|nr:MAG: HAD family hydrolase [Desulfobacterales bacterium]